jgi:methylmalonyl-CoA epimerase
MIFKKVDHIAFAVKNIEAAKKNLIDGFGAKLLFQKENPQQQYTVSILRLGEICFSLLESTTPDGFVAKHIERYGEGVQHIGIQVDDLDKTLDVWRQLGYKTTPVEDVPGIRRQTLLSPKNGMGVVFQVQDWLGPYKYAPDEERFGALWG